MRVGVRSTFAGIAATLVLFGSQALVPAQAEPTPSPTPNKLADAKALVKEYERQLSELGEDYDEAADALEAGKKRLKVIASDIAAQQPKVDVLAEQVRAIALRQFRNRELDTTVQIFTSSDPDSMLSRLSTASKVDQDMNDILAEYQAEQANLRDLQRTQAAEVAALAQQEQKLADLKKQMQEKYEAAEQQVRRLTAQERAALDAEDGGSVDFDPSELDGADANARALSAVKYAISRVKGGQYVWGAAGPANFDCSGLMLAAYRSVGISLPHSSRAQAGRGRAVSRNELKPGDLIFWYHPIHHVGMYIGNGKIVHARNTRSDLVVQTLSSYPAPWAGARRVVG